MIKGEITPVILPMTCAVLEIKNLKSESFVKITLPIVDLKEIMCVKINSKNKNQRHKPTLF